MTAGVVTMYNPIKVSIKNCFLCHTPAFPTDSSEGVIGVCKQFFHQDCFHEHQQTSGCCQGSTQNKVTILAGDTCSICLDTFQKDTKEISIGICNHVFHSECLQPWLLKNSCPLCRRSWAESQKPVLQQENILGVEHCSAIFLRTSSGWERIYERGDIVDNPLSLLEHIPEIPEEYMDLQRYDVYLKVVQRTTRFEERDEIVENITTSNTLLIKTNTVGTHC